MSGEFEIVDVVREVYEIQNALCRCYVSHANGVGRGY